jgi:hypothetical protein
MRKHFYPVTVPLKLITLREVNKNRQLRAAYQADEWARGAVGEPVRRPV